MSTDRNTYNDLDVAAGKENGSNVRGGYRGKRAGKKVQAAKQARKSMSSTTVKKAQTATYAAKNFSTTKETRMLLHTLAKECNGRQSLKGTNSVQHIDSKSKDSCKYSNTVYESQHLNYKQSTVDKPQNLDNLSKEVSLQVNGRPYRGTRAGKNVKMQRNCTKVAMLLKALSSECSKTDFFM